METARPSNSDNGYRNPIGVSNPGLILILLDQSGSMSDNNKAQEASNAVNRLIYEIMVASRSGEQIKDRCYVGVIGYGTSVYPITGGRISEVAANPIRVETVEKMVPDIVGELVSVNMDMPVWVEPKAENGKPMSEAFEKIYFLIEKWINQNPNNFPPIVMNVTDGEVKNQSDIKIAVNKVMNLGTSDGKALVFNACITGLKASINVQFPSSASELTDQYTKFLFDISSEIPPRLFQAAQEVGLMPQANARGLVLNATTETLIKLLTFGSSVVR